MLREVNIGIFRQNVWISVLYAPNDAAVFRQDFTHSIMEGAAEAINIFNDYASISVEIVKQSILEEQCVAGR